MRRYIARTLADYFAADNPRFDRDRFLTAATSVDWPEDPS